MLPNFLVYLEAQKPIKFNNITIYQIPLNDILDYNIEKYNELLLPFLLDMDDFDILDKTLIQGMNIFDILLLNKETLTMLLNAISYFCKIDKIVFDEQKGVLYVGEGYIDRDNFSDFSEIILKINAKQKTQKEKPPENMSEKQRDIWQKLQEGRQRALAKSQVDLADLINTCQFAGDYYISINEISQWTLWNIARCYKSIFGKNNFRESFEIYCITGEDKLIKNRHWSDLIKVDNDENIRKG